MNYTVFWLPDALGELAAVWTAAADRNAATAASYRIDQLLAADTLDTGESREGDERLVIERPLQARFRVSPGEQRVEVLSVGRFGR